MRFGNIGEFPAGQAFDLKIVAQDPFVNLNGYVNLNGIWNNLKFGNIALDSTGKGNEYVNEVKLNLSFVRPGSETPVVLPEFFFAVFDVDASFACHRLSEQTRQVIAATESVEDVQVSPLRQK